MGIFRAVSRGKAHAKIKIIMGKDIINKNKILYKNLEPCYCEVIDETVHFTSTGLNHLLYNRRRPRSRKEQVYRARLIPYISMVIENSKTATRQLIEEEPGAVTWNLECEISITGGKRIIKVILYKKGAGKVIFLSAMQRKFIPNNTKN